MRSNPFSHLSQGLRDKKPQAVAIVVAVVIIVIGAGGATAVAVLGQGDVSNSNEPRRFFNVVPDKTEAEEEPTVLPRRLDGVIVAAEDANLVPSCVMIENAAFGGVRPQSGLSRALVVYEVVVEGGITRFMALFAGEESDIVGPVRSARDTYIEFASEYNCSYTHAGGSYTALLALEQLSLRHIDALRESQFFYRDPNKVSPHNLFTSTEELRNSIAAHGWDQQDAPNFAPWYFVDPFDEDLRPRDGEEGYAREAFIGFGGSYDVRYTYNEDDNYYERANGGVDQIDAVNGERITAKNIVIQYVGDGIPIEGKGRVNWPVTGEGKVIVIHDGRQYVGTWKKENRQARTTFVTATGEDIPFVRGNTWVEIVPEGTIVEIQ